VFPKAFVLDGDERVDEVGIDAVVDDPPRVASVGRAGRAQRDAVPVLDGDAETGVT
jgi:hypothetical protein